jgi:hypothetical protein
MSSNRYALGGLGGIQYGIEGTAYSQASDATTDPGITNEDIDLPNPNEHDAMPHGGDGRNVFVNSPNEKDYEFDVPTTVHNEDAPFELALGSRTESTVDQDSDGTDDYTQYLFEETDRLPTATWRHFQDGLDFVAYYIGCKANLDIEWDEGDPLQATFGMQAAQLAYDDLESPSTYSTTLDDTVSPYRAHMMGDVTLGGTVFATVNGGSWSWDNGLEPQHHGGDAGREAYSIAETTAAEGRYDMSINLNITDTALYEKAVENQAPIDVEVPFVRQEDGDIYTDAVILRALNAEITDAPITSPAEGVIAEDVQIQPTSTEIEIRTPL